MYKSGESIGSIRNYLIEKYPEFRQNRFYEQLRSNLYKVLRRSLKMIIRYIAVREDQNFPEMVPINEGKTNYIYYYKEGQPVREELIDVYLMK